MVKKMFVVLFSIVALLTLTACADDVDEIEDKVDEVDDVEEEIVEVKPHHLEEVDEPLDGLEVHFIDTDRSEDILIRTADTTILMSTNDYIIAESPIPYLESQLVDEIDLLITTTGDIDIHTHLPDILERFPTKELWIPTYGVEWLPALPRIVTAIETQDISLHTPLTSETRTIGNTHLEVVESRQNSLAVKVTYGDMSYLFGSVTDIQMERGRFDTDLRSTVLKPSYNDDDGSVTEFLQAVDPKVAVILSKINTGYQTSNRIKALDELGIDRYGTLDHGTIVISTDGKSYHIETETKPTSVDPYHRPDDHKPRSLKNDK